MDLKCVLIKTSLFLFNSHSRTVHYDMIFRNLYLVKSKYDTTEVNN